jgi:hypothetical protein
VFLKRKRKCVTSYQRAGVPCRAGFKLPLHRSALLLCLRAFAAWAIFAGQKTSDSAALHSGYELAGARSAPYEYLRDFRATMLKIFRSLRKFFEPGPSLPLCHSGESRKGIQVGWWCGRRVRHNFLPARRRKGWIPASAGMTENEPAFHVWLRLCRARRFVVKDCSPLVRLRRAAFFAVNRLFTFFPALRDSEHGWAFRRRKREYRPPPQRNTARSFRASRIRGAAYR